MPPVERVLMTADAVGGVWTYVVGLCGELSARRIRVTVAVMGPAPSAEQRAELTHCHGITVVDRPFRLEWMDDPWPDVAAAGEWLMELEQQVQPDIVHLNGYCHGALPWRSPAVVVGHSCVRSWWRGVHGTDAPEEWRTYTNAVRRGLQAAAAVVAPSRTMLRWLHQHYGELANAYVIYNGRRSPSVEAPKERFVFSAGRMWDVAKNVSALCAAASHVPWPIAVAGDTGPAARRPGADDRVHYLGPLDTFAVEQWMVRAAIYALPARYEPFGLSVLEAAHAGCALVLGDIPTLREIWDDAAIYVDPEDHLGLAAALSGLMSDGAFRVQLAHRARRRAAALTPRRMADAYCDLYSELIGERRPLLSLGTV